MYVFTIHPTIIIQQSLIVLLEDVSQSTLATILPVKVSCHKNACPTLWSWTLSSQALDLPPIIHLVVF